MCVHVCVVLARFWYQGSVGLRKCVRKYCLFCNILEESEKDRYQIVSECLLDYSSEAIWSWGDV